MKPRLCLAPVRTGRTVTLTALLMAVTLLAVSCTRVPSALRSKIPVTGRVLADGKPVSGVDVAFMPDQWERHRFALERSDYATTDSLGIYSVHLISGLYAVDIETPIGSGLLSRSEQVTVSADHSRLDFAFEGHRVQGTVLAPNGMAVDSGQVGVLLLTPERAQAASSIHQGKYSLLLPTGRYSLYARSANYSSGFGPQFLESVTVSADTIIDFQMGGISVSGQVLGPEGRPLKHATVEAEEVRPGTARIGFGLIMNTTVSDGRYQLYVRPGSYWFWFRCPYPYSILPRIVGPMTIHEPTTINAELSGVEWKGTVRRTGTSSPVYDASVLAKTIEDANQRTTAIRVDSLGAFRLILEPGLRYDLETYDPLRRERNVIEAVTASVDTTFEVLLPPEITPSRSDSTIQLSIQSVSGKKVHQRKNRKPPDVIETTFFNTDRDTVTLVRPGYSDYWDGGAPIVAWEIRTPEGQRLERATVYTCGHVTTLRADQIFRLAPGERRTFTTPVPEHYRYESGSHRYLFRLSYENRPRLDWRGRPTRDHNPDALRLLQQSTPCRLVSNTLELEVESHDR